MAKITQNIPSLLTFEDLLNNSLKQTMQGFERVSVYKAVLLLSLTTGLEISFIFTFRWKDLLSLGSENDAKVNNELSVRKYPIPIHPKVKQQLSEIYAALGFPKLDSLIIDKLPKNDSIERARLPEYIITSLSSNRSKFLRMDNSFLKKFNFEDFTQVLFGRKVFEVYGYTSEISKTLKHHFELRLNEDLFNALGYGSKDEIVYELSNINLDCRQVPIEFEDKNFNQGYPFQKFTAFARFLLNGKTFYSEPVTNSIRLMLLLSVYNGIRPSTLIRLDWKDIVQIDKTQKTIEIRKLINLGDYHVRIGKELRDKFLYHFELRMDRLPKSPLEVADMRYSIPEKVKFKRMPKMDSPVFVMNTDSRISQPSLSREIKKGLRQMEFPHFDKLTSKTTVIMYGRRILEIKGNHKMTIKRLKEHFNFKSEAELFRFLSLDYDKTGLKFNGRMRRNMFEEILYNL